MYCTVVISVGLQVSILHGTVEGEIKCPIYIVVMTVALPCSDGTNPAMSSTKEAVGWSLAPIVIVDGGVGGHRQQQSSSKEVAVGGAKGANRCH